MPEPNCRNQLHTVAFSDPICSISPDFSSCRLYCSVNTLLNAIHTLLDVQGNCTRTPPASFRVPEFLPVSTDDRQCVILIDDTFRFYGRVWVSSFYIIPMSMKNVHVTELKSVGERFTWSDTPAPAAYISSVTFYVGVQHRYLANSNARAGTPLQGIYNNQGELFVSSAFLYE